MYYRWKRSGGKAASLALNYRPGRQKLSPAKVDEMLENCARRGIASYRAAYQQISRPAATYSAFWYALGRERREALRGLFAIRRLVVRCERKVAAILAETSAKPPTKAKL
jgi:hypothetical protein